MKIIYYNKDSDIEDVFQLHAAKIPILASTLLETSVSLWKSIADNLSEQVSFHFPKNWQEFAEGEFYSDLTIDLHFSGPEYIVFTNALELPMYGLSKEDLRIVAGNKNKMLGNIAFADSIHLKSAAERTNYNPVEITLDNYLSVSYDMLKDNEGYGTADNLFGNPIIVGTVENSTVCGPSYISEDSQVVDSLIYPGSIVISSQVFTSEVFNSLVHSSKLAKSKLKDSILTSAVVEQTKLSSSVVPKGAIIRGKTP